MPPQVELNEVIRHCRVEDGGALNEKGYSSGKLKGSFPPIQLKLTMKTFDVDCFLWESSMFVSERLRQAMALEPLSIEYFAVDSSQSAPVPRSQNYMLMNIPIIEDVSDSSRSRYLTRELTPGGVSVNHSVEKVAIRPDATPAHSLFHDQTFRGYIFCTDELALRILKAGCSGIRFFDPSRLGFAKPMRFRTLRGVEEAIGLDPVTQVERTTLIEGIE
jgi:hypothetical protein